jgi:hypothetical protein
MKELFEGRPALMRSNPQPHRKELECFGSWFASGRCGEEWSLAKLREVLKLVGSAEPDTVWLWISWSNWRLFIRQKFWSVCG